VLPSEADELLVLRILAGIPVAFIFAPSAFLVSRAFEQTPGRAVGLFLSAPPAGGAEKEARPTAATAAIGRCRRPFIVSAHMFISKLGSPSTCFGKPRPSDDPKQPSHSTTLATDGKTLHFLATVSKKRGFRPRTPRPR